MADGHDSESTGRGRTVRKPNTQHASPENFSHSSGSRKSDSRTRRAATTSGRGKSTKWSGINAASFDQRERRVPVVGNTYRMGPDPGARFDAARSRREMDDVMKRHLDSADGYQRENAVRLCQVIAEEIRNRIKSMAFARYRIVCDVVIGQKAGQGIQMGSRCVWDLDTDKMVTVTYQNNNLFAVASLYAIYLE